MNTDTKSLAFGGFFGGTISGLLWLAIAWQYGLGLWAIVPVSLVGGCFGWLACDFADAKRSVKTAWNGIVGWKPDVKWWKDYLFFASSATMFAFSMAFWGFLAIRAPWEIIIGAACAMGIVGLIFALITGKGEDFPESGKEFTKMMLIRWNIFTLPLSTLWYVWKGFKWIAPEILPSIKTAGKFWWHAFILAHSSKRRICFIGTTTGAIAGLLFASMNGVNLVLGVLLSGILGALFSLAWNEIVAVRLPGIKPV